MTLHRRPTIKDVAKAAGVTYPTVSRVLSNKPYVALETRERVLHAITELGYRPSAAARSMVTQRTHLLAMVVPHLTDPNFGTLFAGAEREARKRGYSVLVTDFDSAAEDGGLLSEHRVDGVLILEPQNYPGRFLSELPVVELDDAPIDQHAGGRLVGEHFAALEHKNVVFVGGPADSPHARERHLGLLSYFPNAPWFAGDWTAESGYALLEQTLEYAPTALFAANDYVALGLIHALRGRGLRVPDDISLIGFDDIAPAKHFTPALTTVRQPLEQQGSSAAWLLIAKLNNEALPTRERIFPQLILRESTGGKNS
jgi:DNA-binding LacI/PurR family transcriptional regulator